MLDYLSDYRTQDKFKGIHYYPKGALCWFECNQYGDPIGKVYFARRIPDMKLLEIPRRKRGLQRLNQQHNRKHEYKELFAKEKNDMYVLNVVKPRLKQKGKD